MVKDKVLLPCVVVKKRFSSANFSVLSVIFDTASSAMSGNTHTLPHEWFNGKEQFTVQVSTDFEIKIEENMSYVFSGLYQEHVRYGPQFKSDYFFPDIPSDEKAMLRYLDMMPNIGPVRASMIVDRFGISRVEDIIENEPMLLSEISGITEERATKISEEWKMGKALRDVFLWLCNHDVPTSHASKIVDKYKDRTIEVLNDNPYVLTSVKGMGFKTVDALAHRIFDSVPGDMRVLHGTLYSLGEALSDGHLCVPAENLSKVVKHHLDEFKPQENFDDLFQQALRSYLVLARTSGRVFVYLPWVFKGEATVSKIIASMASYESRYEASDEDIDMAEEELLSYLDREISLDELQSEAVMSAFNNKITVISGGGGTGKSTICRCIRTICMRKGLTVSFLTPTGAAAKVISEKTSADGMTIHRALGMIPGSGPNPDCQITSNILVVDEFSMVGIDTLPHLLGAISDIAVTNIVFVGDPQQLPSVSAGNFLSDIIATCDDVANVVILDRIHRQSETSYIPVVADDMSNGIYRGIPEDATDVSMVEVSNEMEAMTSIMGMVSEYARSHGSVDGLQVLSPMYKGMAGVESLCSGIQVMIHDDDSTTMAHKNSVFYIGDRVMHMVNNYEKDVYNGNIGTVVDMGSKLITPEDLHERKFLVVEYDGRQILYVDKEIDEVRVCWCCTIHKYQGSQIDNVILAVTKSNYRMMSRELIYTGVTRAAEKLTLVGSEAMLRRASEISIIKRRFTNTTKMIDMVYSNDFSGFEVVNRHLVRDSEEDVSTG
jgi:exodeoxyribonuclease V alpha subunit